MKLLFLEYSSSAGTQTVALEIIPQFLKQLELLVFVAPNDRLNYYKKFLPHVDNLVYEPLEVANSYLAKIDRICYLLSLMLLKRHKEKGFCYRILKNIRKKIENIHLQKIICQHKLSHCFNLWTYLEPPPNLKIPLGAMAMDLAWQTFDDQEKQKKAHKAFVCWLSKLDILFPISNFTQSEIKRSFPWHQGKSIVVPHGSTFKPSLTVATPKKPFFFYPSSIGINKNHLLLFRVVCKLWREKHDFDLVLTGRETQYLTMEKPHTTIIEDARLFFRQNKNLMAAKVKALGFCPRSAIEEFYHSCLAVVLPSKYEGFGLSLLEALERGVPAICSDIPPFIEQLERYDCKQYISICPVNNEEQLAKQMVAFLKSPPQRYSCTDKLKKWTWHSAVKTYIEELSKI